MDFPGGPVVRLHTSNAGGTGSITGRGSKIPHAMWCHQKKKERIMICAVIEIGAMRA